MGDLRSFLQRAKQSRYAIPDTRAGTDSPNGGIRPFRPTRLSALGLSHPDRRLSGSSFFCHARHNLHPASPGTSASPGKSGDPENIVRPGNPPQLENQPARPSFHPTPVLSAFVPHRSPSPARFTPLFLRRNTRRASPLPPNGMPQEPRRGRPHTNLQAGPDAPTKRAATRRGCRSPTIGFGSDYLLLSWL